MIFAAVAILSGIDYFLDHRKGVENVKKERPKAEKFIGFSLEVPTFTDENKKTIDFDKGLNDLIEVQKYNAEYLKADYFAEVLIAGNGIEKKMSFRELFHRLGVCWEKTGQPYDCDKNGGKK